MNKTTLQRRTLPALHKKTLPALVAGAVMAGITPAALHAQEGHSLALEEVVVTARKRSESLQSAPVSAAVFDADFLAESEINDISEVIGRVPGFVMNADNVTEPNIFMRGIGTDIESAASNSAIGMFVNEVYLSRAMAFSMDLVDIARVEVVRGPQGTLYGKNVTGGVVNFVTNRPSDETDAQVEITAGDYDLIETQGFVNGALGDNLQGRISASYRDRGGFADNTFTGDDMETLESTAVRGQLRYLANDDLEFLFSADYNRREGTAPWIDMEIPSEHNVPFKNRDPRKGPNNITGESDAEVEGADLHINWTTDSGTLTSITAVRKGQFDYLSNDGGSFIDFDALPYDDDGRVDFFTLHFGDGPVSAADFNDDYYVNRKSEEVDSFSQELRWQSAMDGSVNYMLGLFYMYEDIQREEDADYLFVDFWNEGYEGAVTTSKNDTYGAFAELTWDISDSVSAVFGLRYTLDEKDFAVKRSNVGNFLGAPFEDENGNIIQAFSASDSDSWDSIDPAVTLNWQATDDVFLYASASTGFKSGGWNGENATTAAEAAQPYDTEEAVNFEIGGKTQLLDNRLRLNATGFFTTYEDLQTQQFVVYDENLPPDNIIANAGEAEVKGIELEFSAVFTEWWSLSGTYAYQDGEITGDLISTTLGYNPECDCSNLREDTNLKGNTLRRTPENSYNLVNTLSFELGGAGAVDFVVDYSYTDAYFFDNENNPRTKNDAYSVWNASVNWYSPTDKWMLSLWGKNLDDELYASGKVDVIGSVLTSYAPPRTWGATVRWNLD
ncbi:TonB-dependent receptor [Parahaliea mediterranea]|uniref:TonB-dependent receptor n=1 Tax=Parahaliea mediterranea TaxID=651086 RepID=UPI000E2F7AAA|nr:TonB-dependent receptor [Parahaliea mediterranea]